MRPHHSTGGGGRRRGTTPRHSCICPVLIMHDGRHCETLPRPQVPPPPPPPEIPSLLIVSYSKAFKQTFLFCLSFPMSFVFPLFLFIHSLYNHRTTLIFDHVHCLFRSIVQSAQPLLLGVAQPYVCSVGDMCAFCTCLWRAVWVWRWL